MRGLRSSSWPARWRFSVKAEPGLKQDTLSNFAGQTIYFNYEQERWNNRYLFGTVLEGPKLELIATSLRNRHSSEKGLRYGEPLRQQWVILLSSSHQSQWNSLSCLPRKRRSNDDLALKLLYFNGDSVQTASSQIYVSGNCRSAEPHSTNQMAGSSRVVISGFGGINPGLVKLGTFLKTEFGVDVKAL